MWHIVNRRICVCNGYIDQWGLKSFANERMNKFGMKGKHSKLNGNEIVKVERTSQNRRKQERIERVQMGTNSLFID